MCTVRRHVQSHDALISAGDAGASKPSSRDSAIVAACAGQKAAKQADEIHRPSKGLVKVACESSMRGGQLVYLAGPRDVALPPDFGDFWRTMVYCRML